MTVLYAAGTAILAFAAGRAWGAWRGLGWGRHCPTCGRRTLPVAHRGGLRYFARTIVRRWCPGCGWEGLRRRRYRSLEHHATDTVSGFRWAKPSEEDRPLLWKDGDLTKDDGAA